MELLVRAENVSECVQGETRMAERIRSRAAWMSESWSMTLEQSSYCIFQLGLNSSKS
jgi:hypothetical protein